MFSPSQIDHNPSIAIRIKNAHRGLPDSRELVVCENPAVPSEKLVRPVVIEGFPDLAQAASTMIPALLAVLASFRSLFRSRAALQAELFALRHQLLVLQRQRTGRRVPLRTSDRLLWVSFVNIRYPPYAAVRNFRE